MTRAPRPLKGRPWSTSSELTCVLDYIPACGRGHCFPFRGGTWPLLTERSCCTCPGRSSLVCSIRTAPPRHHEAGSQPAGQAVTGPGPATRKPGSLGLLPTNRNSGSPNVCMGSLRGQHHSHGNTETLAASFALLLSCACNGVSQRRRAFMTSSPDG